MTLPSNSIRGTRVGTVRSADVERGPIAPSQDVSYYCHNDHETIVVFALADDVEIPERWSCRVCGFDAGLDPRNPPPPPQVEVFKTHLDYVKERRSDAESERLLNEALTKLRR